VIGGGFIGSEMAAALTMAGRKVTMIFQEDSIGAHLFPADLSESLNQYYRDEGVELLAADSLELVERSGARLRVQTRGERSLEVDGVVAGIGVRPNIELAAKAGLRVDNGIVVDEHLLTSAPDVFAAGDVANFHNVALDMRMRVEHEDNAISMGMVAGKNMAGAREVYNHVPMFYSDLFELGYEAVGEINSTLETIADWQDPFKKGVIYYLDHGRVRGVLLWNVWKQVDRARGLLTETGPFAAADLKIGGEAVVDVKAVRAER
jgi:3-phenylpropionate/trans-cinnamate dioxygenase ferredoxin reductase subunit